MKCGSNYNGARLFFSNTLTCLTVLSGAILLTTKVAFAEIIPNGMCSLTVKLFEDIDSVSNTVNAKKFPFIEELRVFEAEDGYLEMSIGYVKLEDFEEVKSAYVSANLIPPKSYCSTGDNYIRLVPDEEYLNPPRLQEKGTKMYVATEGEKASIRAKVMKYSEEVSELDSGEPVTVHERRSRYSYITSENGTRGWIHSAYLVDAVPINPESAMTSFGIIDALFIENTIQLEILGAAEGVVVIELDSKIAPKHADRIRYLTLENEYDQISIHSVIEDYSVTTGDVEFGLRLDKKNNGKAGTGKSSLPDLSAELSNHSFGRGDVVMARSGDMNDANSQFFFLLNDASYLDGKFTYVGSVTSGIRTLDMLPIFEARDNPDTYVAYINEAKPVYEHDFLQILDGLLSRNALPEFENEALDGDGALTSQEIFSDGNCNLLVGLTKKKNDIVIEQKVKRVDFSKLDEVSLFLNRTGFMKLAISNENGLPALSQSTRDSITGDWITESKSGMFILLNAHRSGIEEELVSSAFDSLFAACRS